MQWLTGYKIPVIENLGVTRVRSYLLQSDSLVRAGLILK